MLIFNISYQVSDSRNATVKHFSLEQKPWTTGGEVASAHSKQNMLLIWFLI